MDLDGAPLDAASDRTRDYLAMRKKARLESQSTVPAPMPKEPSPGTLADSESEVVMVEESVEVSDNQLGLDSMSDAPTLRLGEFDDDDEVEPTQVQPGCTVPLLPVPPLPAPVQESPPCTALALSNGPPPPAPADSAPAPSPATQGQDPEVTQLAMVPQALAQPASSASSSNPTSPSCSTSR